VYYSKTIPVVGASVVGSEVVGVSVVGSDVVGEADVGDAAKTYIPKQMRNLNCEFLTYILYTKGSTSCW
jgi:hypothetical protein